MDALINKSAPARSLWLAPRAQALPFSQLPSYEHGDYLRALGASMDGLEARTPSRGPISLDPEPLLCRANYTSLCGCDVAGLSPGAALLSSLVLVGPPAIGKSAAVRAAAPRAGMDDAAVVVDCDDWLRTHYYSNAGFAASVMRARGCRAYTLMAFADAARDPQGEAALAIGNKIVFGSNYLCDAAAAANAAVIVPGVRSARVTVAARSAQPNKTQMDGPEMVARCRQLLLWAAARGKPVYVADAWDLQSWTASILAKAGAL